MPCFLAAEELGLVKLALALLRACLDRKLLLARQRRTFLKVLSDPASIAQLPSLLPTLAHNAAVGGAHGDVLIDQLVRLFDGKTAAAAALTNPARHYTNTLFRRVHACTQKYPAQNFYHSQRV